jgi:hypothetical protein
MAPTQHPQLRHPHEGSGGLQVLDDRFGRGAIDGIDEHRAQHPGRVEVLLPLLLGRVDLGVGHRPDQVGQRGGQRPKRRHRALAALDVAGVGEGGHDDQAAVLLGGHERQGWGGHDVGDG